MFVGIDQKLGQLSRYFVKKVCLFLNQKISYLIGTNFRVALISRFKKKILEIREINSLLQYFTKRHVCGLFKYFGLIK